MGAFAGINKIGAARDTEYFRAGRYLTYIRAFKEFKNRKGIEKAAFEMTIVAVLDASHAAKEPKGPHDVGHKVSWLYDPMRDAAGPDFKLAVMVITGVPEDQVTPEFCSQLASQANPLEGYFVEWENTVIQTKAGNPFTVIKARRRWSKADVLAKIPKAVLDSLKINADRADD